MAEAAAPTSVGPVRAKLPRGPPCAGGPDMGTRGSKARGLRPFALAAGGGGPEALLLSKLWCNREAESCPASYSIM